MEEKNENEITDNEFNYQGELTKIEKADDGNVYIAGICTTEKMDHDGEVVDLNEVRKVWEDYMTNPVIKYMHSKAEHNKAAVGVVVPSYTDSTGKMWKTEFTDSGPFIVCKISNAPDTDSIRTKVEEGIIKGFSIGGRARRVKMFDPTLQKDVNRVITTRISEISLVDLPANPDSFFSVLKAACVGDNCPINDGTETIEKVDTTEPIEKKEGEGKAPKEWWDNCMGTANGIPGMKDASAFCGWMWAHGKEDFGSQRSAIGKVEDDPVVDQAVAKFEELITENATLKDRLEKLEADLGDMEDLSTHESEDSNLIEINLSEL